MKLPLDGRPWLALQSAKMCDWSLHYWDWMIGDGEPHRKVGESFDWFAPEFWPGRALDISPPVARSAVPCGDYQYRVTAEVIYVGEKTAVAIDFGLTAIGNIDSCPPSIRVGDFVMGEISIGLPLCVEPLPEGIIRRAGRRWQIDRISADLTTYVNGRRDITQITYKEVTSTEKPRLLTTCFTAKSWGVDSPVSNPYPSS